MSLTYAIPDIHGRLDLLLAAIDRIAAHSEGQPATVVTLGDYVDRGPASCGVIEFLMRWNLEPLALIALKGNHEQMMWETCNRYADGDVWLRNGGRETLRSYDPRFSSPPYDIVPQAHLDWIASLGSMHIDQHRVFVHAGVDPSIPLSQQAPTTLLWKRYRKGFAKGHGQKHVVHGHDADPAGPLVMSGRTNLDAMAWKTGRLTVGVFDNDRVGGATQILEVVREPWS